MRKRTSTEQSYEPLVTPESWKGDELRFSVRLTQILDGLFARLRAMRTELAGKLGKTEQAADSAKLGGVSAGSFALKTDTAPNAEKLGGKVPEYYLTPVNLLDNSNFLNPVMQAGFNGVHGTVKYIVDRWKIAGTGTFSRSDVTGLNMKLASGSYVYIYQLMDMLPDGAYTLATYSDKTTVAALSTYTITGGTLSRTSLKYANDGHYIGLYVDEGLLAIQIVVNSTSAAQFAAALMCEGTYTAETLPPYVPKGYAAELSACQYYANVIEADAWGRLGLCKTTQGENAAIWMPTTPPMRPGGVPSVSFLKGEIGDLKVEFNQLVVTGMSGFGCQAGNHHNILINLSGNATTSVIEPFMNRTENNIKILINRDL